MFSDLGLALPFVLGREPSSSSASSSSSSTSSALLFEKSTGVLVSFSPSNCGAVVAWSLEQLKADKGRQNQELTWMATIRRETHPNVTLHDVVDVGGAVLVQLDMMSRPFFCYILATTAATKAVRGGQQGGEGLACPKIASERSEHGLF